MSPSIPTSRIVEDVKRDLLEPPLPMIQRIVDEEQAALDTRRAARAAGEAGR